MHIQRVCDFLAPSDVDLITGGNIARLMNV
jgi:hypothetical protein